MSYLEASGLAKEAAEDALAAKSLSDDEGIRHLALAVNKLSLSMAALAEQLRKDS